MIALLKAIRKPVQVSVFGLGIHLFLLILVIYGLAILQDLLFAYLKQTGFYLIESSIYNFIWILYLPGLILAKRVLGENNVHWALRILMAIIWSIAHLILFSSIFYAISVMLFSPHHYFMTILKSSTANYFFVSAMIYFFAPWFLKKKTLTSKTYKSHFSTKNNGVTDFIPVAEVYFITAEKPYIALRHSGGTSLLSSSLSKISEELDPEIFFRVHRSSIVNKNYIKELRSRKNGDYDAVLVNGERVRFSRHYKSQWGKLLAT